MFAERQVATDPFVGNTAAVKATRAYHEAADRRLGLAASRKEAGARVVSLGKRLEFLHHQRATWADRLAALGADAVVPEPEQFDGEHTGSTAAPSQAEAVAPEPPTSDPDAPARAGRPPGYSSPASSVPAGAGPD